MKRSFLTAILMMSAAFVLQAQDVLIPDLLLEESGPITFQFNVNVSNTHSCDMHFTAMFEQGFKYTPAAIESSVAPGETYTYTIRVDNLSRQPVDRIAISTCCTFTEECEIEPIKETHYLLTDYERGICEGETLRLSCIRPYYIQNPDEWSGPSDGSFYFDVERAYGFINVKASVIDDRAITNTYGDHDQMTVYFKSKGSMRQVIITPGETASFPEKNIKNGEFTININFIDTDDYHSKPSIIWWHTPENPGRFKLSKAPKR